MIFQSILTQFQTLSSGFAQAAKQQLLDYMLQLDNAIQTGQKDQILDSLNQVTAEYMQSSRVF